MKTLMETVWDQERGLIPKKARRDAQAGNQPPGVIQLKDRWRRLGLLWASDATYWSARHCQRWSPGGPSSSAPASWPCLGHPCCHSSPPSTLGFMSHLFFVINFFFFYSREWKQPFHPWPPYTAPSQGDPLVWVLLRF